MKGSLRMQPPIIFADHFCMLWRHPVLRLETGAWFPDSFQPFLP
jgi:hypothetical protein